MGFYVNNLDMPSRCADCPCVEPGDEKTEPYCKVVYQSVFLNEVHRPFWCPAVHVPDNHGNLIDADKLWELIKRMDDIGSLSVEDMTVAILYAPTVIPADPGKDQFGDGPCKEDEEPFIPF